MLRTMNKALRASLPVLLAVASAVGADQSKEDRRQLNYGYGQLKKTYGMMEWLDKLFLIKVESKSLEEFGKSVSARAKRLEGELDRLDKEMPALSAESDGMPDIEDRKQRAIMKDRLLSFAPLVGLQGEDFEHLYLVSAFTMLNQARSLAKIMLEDEKEKPLVAYLEKARAELDALYDQAYKALRDSFVKVKPVQPPQPKKK